MHNAKRPAVFPTLKFLVHALCSQQVCTGNLSVKLDRLYGGFINAVDESIYLGIMSSLNIMLCWY